MKTKMTNNIGLKIISILVSIVLWMVVVSIDDPVISRTYTGINVEVLNGNSITKQGKTYEILDGSDTVSVVISAKRSVLEKMSRDHIKATADMKEMTILDTVSIDVRATKYADMIDSIYPVTKNLKVQVENLQKKQMAINVETEGKPSKGFVVGEVKPGVNILSISGPASIVSKVTSAVATVDVSGMSTDVSTTAQVVLYDGNGDAVNDEMLNVGVTEVHVDVDILETKEIPISVSVSGTPADGFAATGAVIVEPESVIIAGKGSVYDNLGMIEISGEEMSVNGASADVTKTINLHRHLPTGIKLISDDFDGNVVATAIVGKLEIIQIDVPTANIQINNIPVGFQAAVVDIGGYKRIEVQGLADALADMDIASVLGIIDATTMTARNLGNDEQPQYHNGSFDGVVKWSLPAGVNEVGTSVMEVSLYKNDSEVMNDDMNVTQSEAMGGE